MFLVDNNTLLISQNRDEHSEEHLINGFHALSINVPKIEVLNNDPSLLFTKLYTAQLDHKLWYKRVYPDIIRYANYHNYKIKFVNQYIFEKIFFEQPEILDRVAKVYANMYLHFMGYTLFSSKNFFIDILIQNIRDFNSANDDNLFYAHLKNTLIISRWTLSSAVRGRDPRIKEISTIKLKSIQHRDDKEFVYMKILSMIENAIDELRNRVLLNLETTQTFISEQNVQVDEKYLILFDKIKEYYENLDIIRYMAFYEISDIIRKQCVHKNCSNMYSETIEDFGMLGKLFFIEAIWKYAMSKYVFENSIAIRDIIDPLIYQSSHLEALNASYFQMNYANIPSAYLEKLNIAAIRAYICERYESDTAKDYKEQVKCEWERSLFSLLRLINF